MALQTQLSLDEVRGSPAQHPYHLPPQAAAADPPHFHLCIINLVIGTLYCAKGNFDFGVGRLIKASPEP